MIKQRYKSAVAPCRRADNRTGYFILAGMRFRIHLCRALPYIFCLRSRKAHFYIFMTFLNGYVEFS